MAGWTTANGATPGFAYDESGRLRYETNSIGAVTETTYDLIGRVVAVTNLATGAGTTYDYDAAGQRIGVTNDLGEWTRFGYHLDGSLAAMTNSLGYYWIYTNATAGSCCGSSSSGTVTDPLNRKVKSVLSASGLPLEAIREAGGVSRTNKTTYLSGMVSPEQEAEEYPETITDEGGRVRRFVFTDLGQLERATDLSGNTWWTNVYDLQTGALTNVVSPTGETNSYTYDDLDNVKTITFGDGNTLENFYNAENRLSGVSLPSGVALTNKYDFAGRLTNRVAKVNGAVVESASFDYNLNDAVTIMTDNTGGTTNLYDAAGRLYGIDYPSGASVRYEHDLLDRITNVNAKATAQGAAYSTRYQYDSVGNLTNIIDPFSRNIWFQYDEVNRKRQRSLPNGVVTTYDYNDFDQVTRIEHKKDSTVLARFEYERNDGGEPWKITREDGSWVELKYDGALRLTNELYKSLGGAVLEEISYGYDASGSRVRLVKGGSTLTNNVSGGYRITAVKDAANGNTVESYSYDTGGRVTGMIRDGATRSFGYNSVDQLTAVTNGTAWITYLHDANGRRTVSTNSTGTVRRLLVAPTPDTDLESPLLVADAAGDLKQGFVYVGYHPLMRFDAAGNPVYYLEDAMGSVAALADGNGSKAASFNYDGFGNVRSQSGMTAAPGGTAGDFRFHGAWLEEGSGLYNMRAREYDARMGRFMSRDPIEGELRDPEQLAPYAFANSNPFVLADRSGEMSLVELNFSGSMSPYFQAFRQAAVNRAKQYIKDELFNALSSQVTKQLMNLLPGGDYAKLAAAFKGRKFGEVIAEGFCKLLKADSLPEGINFEVGVSETGEPQDDGLNCESILGGELPAVRKGVRRPDFIIGPKPHGQGGRHPQTYLIGEIKYRPISLYAAYVINKHGQAGQLDAIRYYAAKHTYSYVAVFVTLKRDPSLYPTLRATIGKKCIEAGCIGILVTDLHVKRGK